jgi:hypothetical protein
MNSGCPGPQVRKRIPVSSHSCWTSRNMRKPGSGVMQEADGSGAL